MTNNKDSGGAFVMPADRTVQVPVSLLQEAMRSLDLDAVRPELVDDLDALLSQPTPTEHCLSTAHHAPHEWGAHDGQPSTGYFCPGFVAESPRIEDLAPGTRAAIERADLVLGGFVQHDWSSSTSVHEWYRSELRKLRDAIDPSTIRDVTPPTEGTK